MVRRRHLTRLGAAALLATCLSGAPAAVAAPCDDPDDPARVTGGAECLVVHTYGNAGSGAPTLVVFIHGDGTRGGASDYLGGIAKAVAGDGVVSVVLIRPGYFDANRTTSTGLSYRREGDGYRPHVVDAVAGAVGALKARHGAGRVVLVGHSGGAAIAGVILGRHAGLADGAVLVACPCDVTRWRQMRGKRAWPNSLSPYAFAEAVPAGAPVIAVTGAADTHTRAELARDYVSVLMERGIEASFVEAADTGHSRMVRTDAFGDAVRRVTAGN